ncbi:MAG TPA: hypothetical protein VFB29_15850 [Pseudolabrys sp.]|nr:hypothetical protein [Pseudolabrys sp.]
MAALLSENSAQHNGNPVNDDYMHPALYSWRDELPSSFVRLLAYLGAVALLSMAAAHLSQSPKSITSISPVHKSKWIEIEKPFPAFALSIPEAADVPASYAIRRHADGGGRKDILELGESDSAAPYLHVEIYRPGSEIERFAEPVTEIAASAFALGPIEIRAAEQPLASKFGPASVYFFSTSEGTPRKCLAFIRAFADPRLQLSGWFCHGGAEFIELATLACALDRLTLLAAGSEPKVGALFAQAERNRSYCGQRDPILAPTPKYHLLWKALANRPLPRRIGR